MCSSYLGRNDYIMKVELIPVTLTLPPSIQPRSQGVHLSSLIRCIALEIGALDAKWADDMSLVDVREITDPESVLRISIGFAWEQWFIPQLRDVVDHPGEYQVDGIFMTPDGETLTTILTQTGLRTGIAVVEVKATYKSVKTVAPRLVTLDPSDPEDLETQWMWISQCQGYCKALGSRIAFIYVFFICGDYTFPISPQLLCWRVEFTQEEIESKWALIRDYRDERLRTDGESIL